MSVIKINVSNVISSGSTANSAKNILSSDIYRIRIVGTQIDARIRSSNNISNRIERVCSNLQQAEKRIDKLKTVVDKCASEYRKADLQVKKMAEETAAFPKAEKNSPQKQNSFIDKILKCDAAVAKMLSKLIKNNEISGKIGLSGSALSYLSGLYTFYTQKSSKPSEMIASSLKFTKASGSAWSGLYNFYDKKLNAYQAGKLGKKFQKPAKTVSLIGSVCGFSAETIKSYNVFMDENTDVSTRITQLGKNLDSGIDVGKSAVAYKWGQKELTRGFGKYNWGLSAKNSAKLSKANTTLSLASVGINFVSGGASRYYKVTADGTFDMGDMGETGVSACVHGLTSVINQGTFGLSDALGLSDSADKITDGIVNFTENELTDYAVSHPVSSGYIKMASGLVDYSNDENNNIFLRTGAAAIGGTGMVFSMAADCVVDGAKYIGNSVSNFWNSITRH